MCRSKGRTRAEQLAPRPRKLAVAWLRFLRETGDVDTPEEERVLKDEIASAAPEIREAVTLTQEAAFTPGELEAYDRYWDAVRTERTLIEGKTAEAKEEGRAEGREEGRAEGLEAGRAEGLKRGRAEGLEEGRLLERQQLLTKLMAGGLSEAQARTMLGL